MPSTTTVRVGDPAQSYTLDPGQTLTVTAAADGACTVYQYSASVGAGANTATFALTAGQARTFGPYAGAVRFTVQTTAGTAQADVDVLAAAAPDSMRAFTVDITSAQLIAPTAAMLANTRDMFRLNVAPWTRYRSTGTALEEVGEGVAGGAVPSSVSRIVLIGDSQSAFVDSTGPTCTAIVDNGDGTATITFSGSHSWAVGHPIAVNVAPARKFNVMNGTVTAQSNSGTFSVTYTLGGNTSPVTGTLASEVQTLYPWRRSPLGYATWLEVLQSRSIDYVKVCAGGADSRQILSMYNDALLTVQASQASDIIVMPGMNDVYARGWTFDATKASIKALLNRIRATMRRARMWVLLVPARDSGGSAWSSAKQTVHNRLNRWLWLYALQIGATPVDTWRAAQNGITYVNPAASNPDPNTNMSNDGTHQSQVGALAIARALDALMRQTAAVQAGGKQFGHSAMAAQNNALTNPGLTGTGGTKTPGSGSITGNAPDNWIVEISSGTGALTLTSPARTVSADGDAYGNNLSVAVSGQATWRLRQTGLIGAVSAGQQRRLTVPVTITSPVNLTGIELVVFGTKSGDNTNVGLVGTSVAMTSDLTGTLTSPTITLPSGLTALEVFVRFYFGSGGSGTVLIGQPCLELIE